MSERPLIVGLGNPGAEYEWTRHNCGFLVIDLMARQAGSLVKRKDCRALVGSAELDGIVCDLVKPQTYMNLSGESVSCIILKNERTLKAGSLIVISDDLALPFGKLRIRRNGSAGGHNGLKSIIASIKSDEFVRVRIGIQPEHPVGDAKRFVLDGFSKTERAALTEILERAAEAVRVIVRSGIDSAMAEFN